MTFTGTVFGEDDSLSSEKISQMISDDQAIKVLADKATLGLMDYKDVSSVSITTATPTVLLTHSFWVPRPNRILMWSLNYSLIQWGTTQANQRTSLTFFVDGTQIGEQYGELKSVTAGDSFNGMPAKLFYNNPSIGTHSFVIKANLAATNAATTMNAVSHIFDMGQSVAAT